MTAEECPAPGCGVALAAGEVACPGHWRLVPRNVQRDVADAARYGSIPQHMAAVDKAVRSLHAALANTARQRAAAEVGRARRAARRERAMRRSGASS